MTAFLLGLTGSIGMGKSTTAAMFAQEGIPVWDADATVHALYAPQGVAARAVGALYPEVIIDGGVSRPKLRELIARDPSVLDRVQAVVHPLVAAHRAGFIAKAAAPIVVLDIPLLFESGADAECDAVVVVSAPAVIQRQRVLDRGAMSEAEFGLILARQTPDAEKRLRASWVIETTDVEAARVAVKQIIGEIRKRLADA